MCPRIGIFDYQQQVFDEWLGLPCLGLRCTRGSYQPGPFAFVAWSGGHPGGDVLGLEVDDGAVIALSSG